MVNFHKKASIILAIASLVIIASIGIERVLFIVDSVPYSNAVEFIKSDPAIRQRFGNINTLGIPTGDINSVEGRCYFKVKITGELQTEKIGIELKEGSYGTWTVISWKIL